MSDTLQSGWWIARISVLAGALLILHPSPSAAQFGGTIRSVACSGAITSALQAAIDAAADTDVINIGAGNCSAGKVSWTNKNIKVQGQGIGATTVSGLTFSVNVTAKAGFRITGMSVGCAPTWKIDAVNRTTGIKGWRIDNISWSCSSCTQNIAVDVLGLTWGLIDSSTFNNMGNAIYLESYAENTDEVNPWPSDGNPGLGGYAWALPLNLGTDEAVYVEDNTFTLTNNCFYGVGDMYYGAKMVFRHNSVTNAYWQNHAARGSERGGNRGAEIYNNDFNALDPAWTQRSIFVRARASCSTTGSADTSSRWTSTISAATARTPIRRSARARDRAPGMATHRAKPGGPALTRSAGGPALSTRIRPLCRCMRGTTAPMPGAPQAARARTTGSSKATGTGMCWRAATSSTTARRQSPDTCR